MVIHISDKIKGISVFIFNSLVTKYIRNKVLYDYIHIHYADKDNRDLSSFYCHYKIECAKHLTNNLYIKLHLIHIIWSLATDVHILKADEKK